MVDALSLHVVKIVFTVPSFMNDSWTKYKIQVDS